MQATGTEAFMIRVFLSALACVALIGTAPAQGLKLSAPLPPDGDVWSFAINDDGSQVVYVANPDGLFGGEALMSRRVEPGGLARELAAYPDGYLLGGKQRITPDGDRVVYGAAMDFLGPVELYSVPSDGSAPPIRLSPPLGDMDVQEIELVPSGDRALFIAGINNGNGNQGRLLYSVRIDGSAAPVLLFSASSGDLAPDFALEPLGGLVVFSSFGRLYRVPLDGSASAVLLGDGGYFWITPDGQRVVAIRQGGLASVPLDGSLPWTTLCGPFPWQQAILRATDVGLSADSSRVVYLSDSAADDVFELYSVPVDGSAAPVRLNVSPVAGGDVLHFAISGDSTRVVYNADQDTNDAVELYSVPIEGGQPPVRLNPPLVAGGSVDALPFVLTPDSSRVVYRGDQDTNDVVELFSVPTEGGSAVRLSGPLGPHSDVQRDFRVDALSQRVVFTGDLETNFVEELFSAPIDGSAGRRKESGSLVSGGRVQRDHRIASDGSFVVYRADQDVVAQYELYLSFLEPRSARGRTTAPSVTVQRP
jgi:hypothetical protein